MVRNGEDEQLSGGIGSPYRRRRLVAMSLALLLTAAAAAVVVVATADDDDPKSRAAPTTSPTPVPSPSSEEASPTPEESASPSPEVSLTPTPSPSPSATPSASPTPSRSSTPRPTATRRAFPPKGLVLEVTGEPISGDPPQVRFRIRVRDNDGSDVNGTINFGDGTSLVYSRRAPSSCPTRPSEPAPGYRTQSIDRGWTVTHAYNVGGRYVVTVTADTDRPCDGTPAESARKTLIVEVPNRPTPSPTPSPTFISTPSPTASASASPSPSSS